MDALACVHCTNGQNRNYTENLGMNTDAYKAKDETETEGKWNEIQTHCICVFLHMIQ